MSPCWIDYLSMSLIRLADHKIDDLSTEKVTIYTKYPIVWVWIKGLRSHNEGCTYIPTRPPDEQSQSSKMINNLL